MRQYYLARRTRMVPRHTRTRRSVAKRPVRRVLGITEFPPTSFTPTHGVHRGRGRTDVDGWSIVDVDGLGPLAPIDAVSA